MGGLVDRFPLFPLGLVLLPGEVVPLHIFEERYKLMIGECLDGESEFGIVWLSDEELKDTGCAARVTQLLERMEDGRMNILVQGTTPFLLQRRIDDLPYPAGDAALRSGASEMRRPRSATSSSLMLSVWKPAASSSRRTVVTPST